MVGREENAIYERGLINLEGISFDNSLIVPNNNMI
jgi:hypothetical protein